MEDFKTDSKEKKDMYLAKYNIPESEVSYCASTLKQAEEIRKNPKKLAAIKEYLGDEVEENTEMISTFEELEKYAEKRTGKDGKDVYSASDLDDPEEPEDSYEAPVKKEKKKA